MTGPSNAERFWASVVKTDTCWMWTGTASNGYGGFHVLGQRAPVRAHRYSYELLVGPIPTGLVLDHLCRVTRCVNPDHLEPVTQHENVMRSEGITAQNARKTHCHKGHPLSGRNLYTAFNKGKIRRGCRTCNLAAKEAARRARGVPPLGESPTCRRGHPWTPETTQPLRGGGRTCRTCSRAGQKARKAAARARLTVEDAAA